MKPGGRHGEDPTKGLSEQLKKFNCLSDSTLALQSPTFLVGSYGNFRNPRAVTSRRSSDCFLNCPPDSTRLLTQICDPIGSTSHVVTMACPNITINVSICARIRPRALTNKSQNCGNSESCDKICIKFWLLFT